MPTTDHGQPPDAHRRCDCGGCREFRAITREPRREWYPPIRPTDDPPAVKPIRRLRRSA